jgi:hypothetical protein
MSKRVALVCFLLLAALFVVVNRGAYKGFFTDDDFDHLSRTRTASPAVFIQGLLTPRFQPDNFRPVGHLIYRAEQAFFGFDFPKYVAVLHLLHLFNVWLVWLLARRLGARPLPAAAACAFFAFHMGFFDAVWKPAYIFDVLCATFCLLSILTYARGRWILSFICFWLAYKAKEPAVMLPFVLACYEIWFGSRKWKPLIPFFLVSFSFGLQGLLFNPNHDSVFGFRFTADALATTGAFYAGRVFLVPYLGFALLIALWFARNHRVRFGLAAMLLFFIPVLFLPGRMDTAYCYLPFAALAILFAGLAETVHPAVIAVFFLLWLPLDLHALRVERRGKLARDDDARAWVTAWDRYARGNTPPDKVIYSDEPDGFASWGVIGAIKCSYRQAPPDIQYANPPALPAGAGNARIAFASWNTSLHKLDIAEYSPQKPDASFIDTTSATPIWQLEKGWYAAENGFRWIAPTATARLARPEGATRFQLRVLVTSTLLDKVGPVTVHVSIGDRELQPRLIAKPGWQPLDWPLPPASAGSVQVSIHSEPPFQPSGDPRTLGVAVSDFGFEPHL